MTIFAALHADLREVNRRYGQSYLTTVLVGRGFHALLAYRVGHALLEWHVPLIPMACWRAVQILYAIDLDPRCQIEPGVAIVHGVGLVVGQGVKVGSGTILFHGVTLGVKGGGANDGFPTIEEQCVLGAGATVVGAVVVGARSIIGPNVVLTESVDPDSIVKCATPTVTQRGRVRDGLDAVVA